MFDLELGDEETMEKTLEYEEALKIQAPKLHLATMLAQAMDYVRKHFREEEELMLWLQYPALHEHRAEHQRINEKIVKVLQELRTSLDAAHVPQSASIRAFLREHIEQSDARLREFIRQKVQRAPNTEQMYPKKK